MLDNYGDALPHTGIGTVYIEFTVLGAEIGCSTCQRLATPVLFRPANASTNMPADLQLYWSKISGADGYRIFISESYSGLESLSDIDEQCPDCIVNERVSSSDYSVPSGRLEKSTKYYWMVRAGNTNARSYNSEIWSFTTSDDPTQSGSGHSNVCQKFPISIPDIPLPPIPGCEDKEPPKIHYMDIWQSGTGFAIITVKATDNTGDPIVKLKFNGWDSLMTAKGDGIFKAKVDYEPICTNTYQVTAIDK